MFERFTTSARQAVIGAQQEARQLHHECIGTEHLLLGLLDQPETIAGQALSGRGLTRQRAVEALASHLGSGALDEGALGSLGIDLDAVRENVEANFGPGALDRPASRSRDRGRGRRRHIPFTSRAKKTLELSLREAIHLKHTGIGDGHVLLGLIREENGQAVAVLRECGVDTAELRRDITAALDAGESTAS